jgi:hypothetical protein
MTWGFPAQRRADKFAALLEGPSTLLVAVRDAPLLELVGALRGLPEAIPRPEFVADLRERLMAEAATVLTPSPAGASDLDRLRLPARQPRRERRLAAAVGGLAILGASTGVAMASQSALPGDALYPVKRAIESAHADLSVGEASKGSTILASASDRLQEVKALAHRDGTARDAEVAGTLATFTDQATEASDLLLADYHHTGDPQSIVRLHDFASSSLDQLAALEPLVPAEARDELIRAASTLAAIDSQAGQQCPACGGTRITSIPSILVAALQGPATLPAVPSPVAQPGTTSPHGHGGHLGHRGGAQGGSGGSDTDASGPGLPQVDPGQLGPGSVLGAGSGPTTSSGSGSGSNSGSGSAGGASTPANPLQPLTDALTGGGNGGSVAPSGRPSLPSVGDVVQGTDDTLDQLLHGIANPLTGPTQAP